MIDPVPYRYSMMWTDISTHQFFQPTSFLYLRAVFFFSHEKEGFEAEEKFNEGYSKNLTHFRLFYFSYAFCFFSNIALSKCLVL